MSVTFGPSHRPAVAFVVSCLCTGAIEAAPRHTERRDAVAALPPSLLLTEPFPGCETPDLGVTSMVHVHTSPTTPATCMAS